LEAPCTYLILPRHIRRQARFITFGLPQPPLSNVVVAGTAIGLVEHKGENKCSNIMACRGGALKHVKSRHERGAVFQEDNMHPSVEAGLRVAYTSKPGDELGAVLVGIELVLGPKVYPTQQHPPQWYAPSHYGVTHTLRIYEQVARRLLRSSMGSTEAAAMRLAISTTISFGSNSME
jgi:hypothetical protein